MEVRHVLVDPDYFLLVEVLPQEKKPEEEQKIIQTIDLRTIHIKIHKKVYLRNVESLVDRSEPRNLIVGFVIETVQSKQSVMNLPNQRNKGKILKHQISSDNLVEMLLYFENANKCTYVKNMLDFSKQTLRQRQIKNARKFLEKTLDDIPEVEGKLNEEFNTA